MLPRLEAELQSYAEELARHQKDTRTYSADDYLELIKGICRAMERHHGEDALAQMSDETILKVIRSQVSEVVRLNRLDKLMGKRDRV